MSRSVSRRFSRIRVLLTVGIAAGGVTAASTLWRNRRTRHTQPTVSAKPIPQAEGITIHHCSCEVGCPCMFGPQLAGCRMVMVHHVDRGTARGRDLAGATIVTVYPSLADLRIKPRPKFEAAVYVDRSFPRETQELLVRIFTPRRVRQDQRMVATPADITFNRTARGFRTKVKGFLTAETTARTGRDDKQLIVQNVNFAEGTEWHVGENVVLSLNDTFAKWKWDLKGKNGTWTEWAWTGGNTPVPAVDEDKLPPGVSDNRGMRVACNCCGG